MERGRVWAAPLVELESAWLQPLAQATPIAAQAISGRQKLVVLTRMKCISKGTLVASEAGEGFLQTYRAVVKSGGKCWALDPKFSVITIGRGKKGVNQSRPAVSNIQLMLPL